MKKILAVLLLIVVLALMIGCKPTTPAEEEDGDVAEIEEEMAGIDELEEELDLSELESLEEDLGLI